MRTYFGFKNNHHILFPIFSGSVHKDVSFCCYLTADGCAALSDMGLAGRREPQWGTRLCNHPD